MVEQKKKYKAEIYLKLPSMTGREYDPSMMEQTYGGSYALPDRPSFTNNQPHNVNREERMAELDALDIRLAREGRTPIDLALKRRRMTKR